MGAFTKPGAIWVGTVPYTYLPRKTAMPTFSVTSGIEPSAVRNKENRSACMNVLTRHRNLDLWKVLSECVSKSNH